MLDVLRRRGISSPAVLDAFASVPRDAFVPEHLIESAYQDRPLPIGEGQTISQPYVVALMTEAVDIDEHSRVLEIGGGSGYAAAILGRIAQEVYVVEIRETLADRARGVLADLGYENVHVHCGDGSLGLEEHAPYDAIIVSAGAPAIPEALYQQLGDGGRLVLPVGINPRWQDLVRVTKLADGNRREERLCPVAFVPLVGAQGWDDDGFL